MKIVSKRTSALLATVWLCAACAPRVSLPRALERSAPMELRRAQYNRYRAVHMAVTVNQLPGNCGTYGCAGSTETSYSQVQLANGAVVLDPADLLPLVARDSRTWGHVETARSHETAGIITLTSTLPLTALGVGFLFGGGALGWNETTTYGVSISLLVLGGLAAISGGVLRATTAAEQRQAFERFDDDFRDNLGLCVGPIERGECSPSSTRIKADLTGLPSTSPLGAGLSLRF